MHFAATVENGVAHVLNDTRQLIGSYMGMGVSEYIRGSAVLAEDVENLLDIAALLRTGVEFAVGIGACPTLSKTVVALAVHLLRLRNQGQILLALADILSTFQNDGTEAQLYQFQGGKESAGARPYDDDLLTVAHIGIFGMNIGVIGRLLIDIGTHLEIDEDGTLTGIDAAFQHPHMTEGTHVKSFFA